MNQARATKSVRTAFTFVGATAVAAAALGFVLLRGSDPSRAGDWCGSQAGTYPFTSVSCSLLDADGMRFQGVQSSEAPPVSQQEAEAVAVRLNPGANVLESHLTYVWTPDDSEANSPRALRWAVALDLTDGIYISSGASYMAELKRIRPGLDVKEHPLTEEELAEVSRGVGATVSALRASFTEQYHIDFIDAVTGDWIWAAEGAR